MSSLSIFRIVSLASVSMLAFIVAATAQDASTPGAAPSLGEVSLGVNGVTDSSAVFGRYNGMPNSGAGVTASANLHSRDAWDSGGTNYWSFTANNINAGLGEIAPEASANFTVGQLGTWEVSANYDAMVYRASNDFTTILNQNGSLVPAFQNALNNANMFFTNTTTNPSTLFGAFSSSTHIASANGMAAFGTANEVSDIIGTRRDKGTLIGKYDIGDWVITTSVMDEHKEGTLEQSMTTAGSNTGFVAFPMPVNYDTGIYTATAAYLTDDMQAKFSYEFSDFIEHNPGGYSFEGWNFSAYQNPTTKLYTSYEKNGTYSLPPSNQAHTFTGEFDYNFDPTTRLYSTAVYGLQLQNASFVSPTGNGYVYSAAGIASGLTADLASNPNSLNGFVQTFFGNVMLTTRPLPELNIKASYKIDARDPSTSPMWIYGDPTDTTALKYRQAVPESWTKQEASLSVDYHVLQETVVAASYTFRDAVRSNAITHVAVDDEFAASVRSQLSTDITGSINYLHANRSASAPDYSLWLTEIAADCVGTPASSLTLGCKQVPYYEAARTQDSVNGNLSGMLDEQTTFTLFAKFNNDNYHQPSAQYQASSTLPVTTNPGVGLNRDYSIQAGPDLEYRIDQDAEVHFYYTFLRSYRDMSALNNQTVVGGSNFYDVASTYDIHTAGIGGTWHATDKLKLVGDYTFSYAGQSFAQSGTWDLGYQGDPLLNTKDADNQVRVHALYDYSPSTHLYFGYEFDSVSMTNFSLVGQLAGQVLTNDMAPKYNVSTISAGVTIKL